MTRNAQEKQELRVWAEEESKKLLRLSELHYGEISHNTATAHMVQADVFVDMDRLVLYFIKHTQDKNVLL